MTQEHQYKLPAVLLGGTMNIRSYYRSHIVMIQGKPELFLTTDNLEVGDKSKLNPDDLLVYLMCVFIQFVRKYLIVSL
jgi:hypothetical protein